VRILIRLIIAAAFIVGILVGYSHWDEARRAERRRQQAAETEATQQREAIISGQTPATPPAAQISPTTEQQFRDLAQRHSVAIEEFTSLSGREAVVALRGTGHTAIGDLLDAARRDGLLFDFDVDMLSRNRTATVGPNGERIMQSRFTIQFQ
jgi:hypothetical protein